MDPFARKMLQASLGFAGVMLVMFSVFTTAYFHLNPRCTEQTLAQATSPGSQWTADLMERRCGQNESVATHVNLRVAGAGQAIAYFSGKSTDGEIFTADLDGLSAAVNLEWKAPDHLTVRCGGCNAESAIRRDQQWRGVQISYVFGK